MVIALVLLAYVGCLDQVEKTSSWPLYDPGQRCTARGGGGEDNQARQCCKTVQKLGCEVWYNNNEKISLTDIRACIDPIKCFHEANDLCARGILISLVSEANNWKKKTDDLWVEFLVGKS